MTTIVALVGKEPLPNLLPIKQLGSTASMLLYTKEMRTRYENQSAVLARLGIAVSGIQIDAFDITANVRALEAELSKRSTDEEVVINLTGGTKPMAIAGFEVARSLRLPVMYLESNRTRSDLHRYAWQFGSLVPVDVIPISVCVTLEEYLDAHLGPGSWQDGRPDGLSPEGIAFEDEVARVVSEVADELRTAVRAMNRTLEIDIIARKDINFAIFEVKYGTGGRKVDGLRQLTTAGSTLGIFTNRFFVITVEPHVNHADLAKSLGIHVVSLLGSLDRPGSMNERDAKQLREFVKGMLDPQPQITSLS